MIKNFLSTLEANNVQNSRVPVLLTKVSPIEVWALPLFSSGVEAKGLKKNQKARNYPFSTADCGLFIDNGMACRG